MFSRKKKLVTPILIFVCYSILTAGWDIAEIGPPWNPGELEFFNEDTGFAGKIRTTDGGITWENDWIFPPFGNPVRFQMVSAREGWLVFQMEGVTRPRHNLAVTTDCGDSWTQVYDCETDFPYITQIRKFQFTDIKHGWIKGESDDTSYFFKTDDGGESWYNIYIDPYENCFEPYFVDSLNGYAWWSYYVDRFIIYRTMDGGLNWDSVSTVRIPSECEIAEVWCKEFGDLWLGAGDIGYTYDCRAVGPRLLLHSSDSGETFDTLFFDLEAGQLIAIAFRESLGIVSDISRNIFYTTDHGEFWSSSFFEHYDYIISFSFRTPDEIWGSGGFQFYKSNDRGLSWEDVNPIGRITWRYVTCNSTGGVGVGCSNASIGYLKFSSDGGESWFYSYPDVGDAWIKMILDIEMEDSTTWYVLLEYARCRAVFKTTNGGIDWEMIFHETITGFPVLRLTDIEITPQKIWLTAGREGELYCSSDGGTTWDTLTNPHGSWRILSYTAKYLWVEYTNGDVFWHSTNGGESWYLQAVGGDTLSSIFEVEDVFFLDSLYGWCLSRGCSVYVTINGGDHWDLVSETPDVTMSYYTSIGFINPTHGFIAGNGLFESIDGGVTWTEIPGFSDFVFYDMDFADSAIGYAVGEQGVIIRYSPSEWIDESDKLNKPFKFSLFCYPNPFNKSVSIKIHTNTKRTIKLIVNDISGREIAVLFDGILDSDYKEIRWEANNSNNQVVPSGIYFIKILMDNKITNIEKILFIK